MEIYKEDTSGSSTKIGFLKPLGYCKTKLVTLAEGSLIRVQCTLEIHSRSSTDQRFQ